jgi:DNA-binding NarL/FixJ family response regulator
MPAARWPCPWCGGALLVTLDRAPSATPSPLTDRERAILGGLRRGESLMEIAAALGLSRRTVEGHLGTAMAKLGVHSRLAAVLRADAQGWLNFA